MYNQKIKEIIAEVLSLEAVSIVKDDSNIVNDLGAESIDFIDMCFKLEQELELPKVNVNDIFPVMYMEENIFNTGGEIRESVAKDLQENYPHIDNKIITMVSETHDRAKLYTVKIIERYVEYRKH